MKKIAIFLLIGFIMYSCQKQTDSPLSDNPFLAEYNTPFQVPPFDLIKDSHFMPAIEKGMEIQNSEIEAIIINKDEPTFENTIVAYEQSGDLLTRSSRVFFNLNSADTNPEREKLAREISPLLTAHSDNILMNPRLFARIQTVYQKKDELGLDSEDLRLLNETYKKFIRSGAQLSENDQNELKEINKELSSLTLQFGQNILAETNNFKMFIDNEEDLAGLPEGIREAAAEAATNAGEEGKWLFTLHNPSILPFLHNADNRELREKIKKAYIMRGDNDNEFDNKNIIKKIVELRIKRSQLLGFNNHAEYVLSENMAANPQNVMSFLQQVWTPSLNLARQEAADIQKMINEEGGNFKLEPWDWRYYQEKVRKAKYDIDEEETRPYFELSNVKKGVFEICNKLFGITFVENKEIPVYHPDVVAYEVLDFDRTHLGVFYMDFHPRESKRGGAWMTSYRQQSIKNEEFIHPVVSIVCNFTKPTAETPSLLTFDELTTFLHELGHALHGLFSECKYASLSGTSVPRDFVEFPSKFMENWAFEPEALALFAKHYQTGEIIPAELVQKIENSAKFGQGFATTEYLAASFLDMDYHTLNLYTDFDVDEFETNSLNNIGLIPEIISRYRSTYFNHIFAGGYSAGYYSYIWSEVLDADGFALFKERGVFHRATAISYRENILSRGYTEDPMELYRRFRGHEPEVEPLLIRRGLK